jgi:histidine ammonia-lyase
VTAVLLTGQTLTPEEVARVAAGAPVQLAEASRAAMKTNAAAWLRAEAQPSEVAWLAPFGDGLSADPERLELFARSRCGGAPPPLPEPQVRALMVCRANVLAGARSGCRPGAADLLIGMLNTGVHPLAPAGGAAGDPSALAHVARVALRLGGQALRDGEALPFKLAMAGLPGFKPTPKEALSLMSGATLSAARAALACHRARRGLRSAELALACTLEAAGASPAGLTEPHLAARRHPGAVACAARVRALLEGTSRLSEAGPDGPEVRMAAAGLGAAWEALEHAEAAITRELNAACDDPLMINGLPARGGNLSAAPVALAMTSLGAAVALTAVLSAGRLSIAAGGAPPDALVERAAERARACTPRPRPLLDPAGAAAPARALDAMYAAEDLIETVSVELYLAAGVMDEALAGGAALAPALAELHETLRAFAPRPDDSADLELELHAVSELLRAGLLLHSASPW